MKAAIAAVLLGVSVAPAGAGLPGVDWYPPEVVDSPVLSTPSPAALSMVYWQDHWRAVYEKDGRIWMATRGTSGWTGQAAITDPAIHSSNPHLADLYLSYDPYLMVIWEDGRLGHSEVWARRFDGAQWSLEECLTADAVASRASVIAGTYFGAYVAWEDSSAGSFRVRGRMFDGGWGPVEGISTAPGTGREPSVSFDGFDYFQIVWSDTRTGTPQIMWRPRHGGGSWDSEQRLTPGRHPSIDAEICCGDCLGLTNFFIAYEQPGTGGAVESWGLCYEFPGHETSLLSPDDGIPSIHPQGAGYAFNAFICNPLGGAAPRYYASWTDSLGSGSCRNAITAACNTPAGTELLPPTGRVGCGVSIRDDYPMTEMIAFWIEEVGGVPSLLASVGRLPGCINVTVDIPPALVLAPEGIPPTIVHVVDTCTDAPVDSMEVCIDFTDLDRALTWDPLQSHPFITTSSDEDGNAVFAIRGGGCARTGEAWVNCIDCGMEPLARWTGAKSPDVNGDCVVRPDDLLYVERALGTDDFCADLDGSGIVDTADVAIVEASMWDHCSNVIDVQGQPLSARVSLAATPNPAGTSTMLRLDGPIEGRREIQIFDAGGRLVRSFEAESTPSGVVSFGWDLRDRAGRPVGSGIFFARARLGGTTIEHAIAVVR